MKGYFGDAATENVQSLTSLKEIEKIVIELKEAAKETIRSILTLYLEKIQGIAALPNKDTATCSRCMSISSEKESY